MRGHLQQFETLTLASDHGWISVDLSNILPDFLANHKYRESIFEEPQHFKVGNQLETRATTLLTEACAREDADRDCVIAVVGLATLFDFLRISNLIERVEDSVNGRLLILFPGEYSGNVYRFMDAREGFNYMATPITSTESFINP